MFSPHYTPAVHRASDRRFVGFHYFTERCLLDLRKASVLDEHGLDEWSRGEQRQRMVDAVRKAKICHCAGCARRRLLVLYEQRVLHAQTVEDADHWAKVHLAIEQSEDA